MNHFNWINLHYIIAIYKFSILFFINLILLTELTCVTSYLKPIHVTELIPFTELLCIVRYICELFILTD